ncbi:hypothetical protein [Agrobacterium pusense]|uniref:hypothetical protein n=1 Tax=Agrobacterium pusense TaxID=648995 RepID=UPI003FD11ACD
MKDSKVTVTIRTAAIGVARTFQHVKLAPEMSMIENVMLEAHLRGNAGIFRAFLKFNRSEERLLTKRAARALDVIGFLVARRKPVRT